MIKRYTGAGGPLNIPFYVSLVNCKHCYHAHLTRAEARVCETERQDYRAPVIPITRARSRREAQ